MKTKSIPIQFTLVQHSGYGYAENPQFKAAVQEHMLTDPQDAAKVKRAGGVLFADFKAAYDRAYSENYELRHVRSLIPNAPGKFARTMLDGLRIYIPTHEATGSAGPAQPTARR